MGVSWGHANGTVVVAVGRGRVGADVERLPCATPLSWVRAEALVKWGHADLDTALAWELTEPPAPHGRRYHLPSRGEPRPSRLLSPPWTRSVVVTDAAYEDGTVVCAVAADRPARLQATPLP
jgi:hypothetical protein